MSRYIEWEIFRENFDPPPTRRVAKRLIRDGEIPGKILGDLVYVDVEAFEESSPVTPAPGSVEDPTLQRMLGIA